MSVISEETNLPSTWRWVRCQDIVDVRDGTHDTPTKRNFGIPLITSKNLTPEGLDFSNITYISEEDHQSIEKRSAVDDEDVLFAMIGTIGNPVIVKKDRPFSIKNVALFKLNKSLYYPPFFKELLNTSIIRKQLARNTKGGNQKFVSLSVLREMVIPLPPLEDQKRIAEILDRAEELRSKRREAIAQLDTLTQAIFLEMFGDPTKNPEGWNITKVGEVADVQGGLQVSSTRKKYPCEVPYLRVANVYRGYLDLNEIKVIRATQTEISRTLLKKNDLLIVEGHGNPNEIGRVALWDGSITNCIHQNHIIRARLDTNKIIPLYACHYLNSSGGRQHLLKSGKTTSGLNTISVSEVRSTPISLPPLQLQSEFARRVEAVEKLKAAHRASLSELDALFASLQHRAFRGEL